MTVPAPTSRALKMRARRVEEAKRFSLPPIKTLATMTEAERQEMLRLYGAGTKRSPAEARRLRGDLEGGVSPPGPCSTPLPPPGGEEAALFQKGNHHA